MALQEIWTRRVYGGKFLTVEEMQLEWWKSWEYLSRKWKQQVVAWLLRHEENNSFIIIEQYRYPVKQKVIELVAGIQDKPDLSPEEHMREEVVEETGYRNIEGMNFLAETSGSAGSTSETALLYDIGVSGKRWEQSLEESEDITVLEIPQKEILHFIESRAKNWQIIDPKVCMALYMTLWRIWNIL